MALLDPEVGEQEGDRLAAHRCPPVGMGGELPGLDALLLGRLGDEALGEDGALPCGDHPAGHVARKDVEDHVDLVVGPLGRTTQLAVGVGPRRGAGLSAGPFPRPALRTGRATLAASGSPRVHAAGTGDPGAALVHGAGTVSY